MGLWCLLTLRNSRPRDVLKTFSVLRNVPTNKRLSLVDQWGQNTLQNGGLLPMPKIFWIAAIYGMQQDRQRIAHTPVGACWAHFLLIVNIFVHIKPYLAILKLVSIHQVNCCPIKRKFFDNFLLRIAQWSDWIVQMDCKAVVLTCDIVVRFKDLCLLGLHGDHLTF